MVNRIEVTIPRICTCVSCANWNYFNNYYFTSWFDLKLQQFSFLSIFFNNYLRFFYALKRFDGFSIHLRIQKQKRHRFQVGSQRIQFNILLKFFLPSNTVPYAFRGRCRICYDKKSQSQSYRVNSPLHLMGDYLQTTQDVFNLWSTRFCICTERKRTESLIAFG